MIELPSYPPLSPEGEKEADRAVRFLQELPLVKGRRWAGRPMALMPYQEIPIREFFGRRDSRTGLRQYRTLCIFIAKKNGKSTLVAGVALKLTLADDEPGAEVYGAAYDKDQALIIFEIAAAMAEEHKVLRRLLKVNRHKSRITHGASRSKYDAVAHDTRGLHGPDVSGLLIDEYHTWKDAELFLVLDNGTAARDQPATCITSTAGIYSPELPAWKIYDYATKVRAGVIEDPTFLPVIFEADKADDPFDPATWAKANPGLGVVVNEAYLEKKARDAVNRPTELDTFRQLHLNIWPQTVDAWLDMDLWKVSGAKDRVSERELAGRKCWVATDLASVSDLTAVSIIFRLDDGRVVVRSRFFVPFARINERTKRDHVPYKTWTREGWITATDGAATDYGAVKEEIKRIAERYDVKELVWDPWNALDLANQLEGDGFTVVRIPQTFKYLTGPTKELERLVAEGELLHGNNPVLTWCASNVAIDRDAHGNIKPNKKRSSEKIDGISSLVTGLARLVAYTEAESVYNRRARAGEDPLRSV